MPPPVAPSAQMRWARPAVLFKRRRHFVEAIARQCRADHHLAGKLHPGVAFMVRLYSLEISLCCNSSRRCCPWPRVACRRQLRRRQQDPAHIKPVNNPLERIMKEICARYRHKATTSRLRSRKLWVSTRCIE